MTRSTHSLRWPPTRSLALLLAAGALGAGSAVWMARPIAPDSSPASPSAAVMSDQEMAGIVGAFTRPKATHFPTCPTCAQSTGGASGDQGTTAPHVDPTTGSVSDTVSGPRVRAVGGGESVNFAYNSDLADGSNTALRLSMGYGWTHNYETCLMESGRDLMWVKGDGSISGFRGRFGTWAPLPGEFGTLTQTPTEMHLRSTDGTVFT
jgi:hypothetical protein